MKVKIYGGGCDKCRQLLENTQAALDVAGIDADIEKVTDMKAIADAGVLMTPALEIEGKVVSSGRVLSATEILPLFPEDAQQTSDNCCSCCSCRGDGKSSSASCACAETASDSSAKCCCGKTSSPGKRLLVYLLLTLAAVAVAILLVRRWG